MAAIRNFVAIVALCLVATTHGANIVGLFASLSPSHLVIQMSMARILAESGHNVTVVTALKPPFLPKNITHIQVPLSEDEKQAFNSVFADSAKTDNTNPFLQMLQRVGKMSSAFSKTAKVMDHQLVKDLYENKDNKIDLVIVGYFMSSFHFTLAHRLKVPLVLALSNPPNFLGHILANPRELSYVPAMTTTIKAGEVMGIGKRFANLLGALGHFAFMSIIEYNNEKTYRDMYQDDPTLPAYGELAKNISLIFFSSHGISEGPIRPNVPAVIEVGGIQVKDQPDPLPQNLQDFLTDTPHGAILLSLGSNLKGAHLKQDSVKKMFNVLSKLKQKVIWKWDDLENLPGKSENILFAKWLPQDDILAHPNIKMFITHAGKGSVTEAQYHGKPMLALPVFGDQPGNAADMKLQGFGVIESLVNLEEESFAAGIKEVLENPKYTIAVKKFSELYRDRPLSARDTLVYWVNYVIRHHGAPHLQSPVVHMSFIAANNLDIYVIIVGTLLAIFLAVRFVFRLVIKKIKGSPKVPKHKAKKH
ncbi:UDP-glycosyltransferase UGT5-like [Drosophila bipectinata]|uniref:UDP-glycosyltransferase UGT5-like n=1 Tax=Drosophila bipectinata TaxID=42026 RepID=UPI001C8A048D|nr:UDP-glycosyltransferase UGT5-like [Drosophila bipectinata]